MAASEITASISVAGVSWRISIMAGISEIVMANMASKISASVKARNISKLAGA